MRIQDPFVFDAGHYACIISTTEGDCTTHCDVEVVETFENLFDIIPQFLKFPLPTVALHGNSTSFCTRVTPVDSKVIWSICGREISDDMKDVAVSVKQRYLISQATLPIVSKIFQLVKSNKCQQSWKSFKHLRRDFCSGSLKEIEQVPCTALLLGEATVCKNFTKICQFV